MSSEDQDISKAPKREVLQLRVSKEFLDNQLAQALALHSAAKFDEAEKIYNQLLNYDYKNTRALFLLASLLSQRGKNGLAINLFKRLLDTAPPTAEALNNLARALQAESKRDESLDYYRAALEMLAPDNALRADVLSNLSSMFVQNGTPQQALAYATEALMANPEHAGAKWHKSLAYLELADYPRGFADYDAGLVLGDRLRKTYTLQGRVIPEWDGKTRGETIIVQAEQGIGDEVMYCSLLEDLAQYFPEIILDCHPRLASLLKTHPVKPHCFPFRFSTNCGFLESGELKGIAAPSFRVNLGSLPKLFRRGAADFSRVTFPYLSPAAEQVREMRNRLNSLGSKPVIGIAWVGGNKKTGVERRSVPLDQWLPLLSGEYNYVSLVYSQAESELTGLKDQFGISVHHWQDALDDYDKTAALIASVDLVVSVCTAAVHLSGAFGKTCFALVSRQPDWRYGIAGEQMVWYPSVRIFRQAPGGQWAPTMDAVARSTRERLTAKTMSV
jgi:tetratricopeptide (TPR) repeat protein